MTREDAVSITSRLVALYFFCWTAVSVSYLPNAITAYLYTRQMYSSQMPELVGRAAHSGQMQILNMILELARILVAFALGIWFYRGGQSVTRFFSSTTA